MRAAEMIEEAGGLDLKPGHVQAAAYSLRKIVKDLDNDPAYFEALGLTRQGVEYLRGAAAALDAVDDVLNSNPVRHS